MKDCLIILILLLLTDVTFSQDLSFDVQGTYSRPVKKEKLSGAKEIRDVSPGYPTSWIEDYISVSITATCNGITKSAMSKNDFLTEEQMGVLQSVDLGSDIVVDVNYYKKNAATDASEVNTMHSVLTVIPELEAEFPGGHTEMRQYLHDHAISKISEAKSKKLKDVVIKFTVDENGEVADARITQSSDDHAIDSLLLKAIHKMPKWKPAENAGGLKVRQDFEFRVGTMGC